MWWMIINWIYSIVSLLPDKTVSNCGKIAALLHSAWIDDDDDDVDIVVVLIFCFPFMVSVQRVIVCCMIELRFIAGHETSEPLCHKTVSTFGSRSFFCRRRMLLLRLSGVSSQLPTELIPTSAFTSIFITELDWFSKFITRKVRSSSDSISVSLILLAKIISVGFGTISIL